MSDFYATEKIIGGAVLIGVGSLLMWSVSQNGDAGVPGMFFGAIGVLGAVWSIVGLFELIAGHRWNKRGELTTASMAEPERPQG